MFPKGFFKTSNFEFSAVKIKPQFVKKLQRVSLADSESMKLWRSCGFIPNPICLIPIHIFAVLWCKPNIIHNLIYSISKPTASGCNNVGIIKVGFVTKGQLLYEPSHLFPLHLFNESCLHRRVNILFLFLFKYKYWNYFLLKRRWFY